MKAKRQKKPAEKAPDPAAAAARESRATPAIVQQRIQAVLQIRLDGAEGWDVRHFVAEKEAAGEQPWKIEEGCKPLSERRIREYVQAADKLIADSCRVSRRQAIRLHKAKRRSLYARAVSSGDYATALRVLSDLAALEDLYPPRKVKAEHTGKNGSPLTFTLEQAVQADRQLEEWEKQRAASDRPDERASVDAGRGEEVSP